jgi:hypothetical protein
MDGDGTGDVCDSDIDGDGATNLFDNCPNDANAFQDDLDNDGLGDVCDPDDDNDAALDTSDNCPTVYNPNQSDLDSDGFGDLCDVDLDNDLICNPSSAPVAPGCTGSDNCPSNYNPDQTDADGDGLGDVCDNDPDADGYLEPFDNCPATYNPGQEDNDLDGMGDACDPDDDDDNVADGSDNCPLTPNTDQANWDADALGDACDDGDGDGFTDEVEAHVGTDPSQPCGTDGWPADLHGEGWSANRVDIQDITNFLVPDMRLNTSPGDPTYSIRHDLRPGSGGVLSKEVNIQDIIAILIARPDMLGGEPIFNQDCPAP